MLSLGRREEEQEIKNRMSENQKTILNIKKRKSKQFILQLQTHTNTHIRNKKLYIIVLYLAFYSSKTKRN